MKQPSRQSLVSFLKIELKSLDEQRLLLKREILSFWKTSIPTNAKGRRSFKILNQLKNKYRKIKNKISKLSAISRELKGKESTKP